MKEHKRWWSENNYRRWSPAHSLGGYLSEVEVGYRVHRLLRLSQVGL